MNEHHKNSVEELLEGLKSAISRGDSLQKAMQSFYNAGYKKEDIENAARVIHRKQFELSNMNNANAMQQKQHVQQNRKVEQPQTKVQINSQKKDQPPRPLIKQIPSNQISKRPEKITKNIQHISNYDEKPKSPHKLIIILAVVLVFLLAILGAVFFFQEQIIGFFSKLFP